MQATLLQREMLREEKMRRLRRNELLLIYLLGVIYPLYPAMLLDEIRHGKPSITRVLIILIANTGLLVYFVKKAFSYKINFDIDAYLSQRYSETDQKNIVINYGRYKNKLFGNTPLFTTEALEKDSNLRIYKREALKGVLNLWAGALCYLGALSLLFYIVIWI